MPDRKDFDIRSAPAIGQDVIADDKPARSGASTGNTEVGEIRKLPLSSAEQFLETFCGLWTVFGKKGDDLFRLGRRTS